MADELTPDEEAFFQTGTLPPALAEQHTGAGISDDDEEGDGGSTTLPEDEVRTPAPAIKEPDPAPEQSALEQFMAESRQARLALESRLEDMQRQLAATTAPKIEVEQAPDKFEDPLGNIIHTLGDLNTRITNNEQAAANKEQLTQFTNAVQAQKVEFEATTPDFKDAYAYIRNLRTEDLRAVGAPESGISEILVKDELQLALTAMQRGKNPAAEMYAMAKRYGYSPTKVPVTEVAKAAKDAAITPEAKLAQLRAGAKAAVELPKSGKDVDLTFESLKEASNTDLDALVSDDKLWKTVVGGANGSDIFNR